MYLTYSSFNPSRSLITVKVHINNQLRDYRVFEFNRNAMVIMRNSHNSCV